jgi:hypothetical protein
MNEDLEECRRRLSMPELLRRIGLDKSVGPKADGTGSGHCPFGEHHKHGDENKSFALKLNPRTGHYYGKCFAACGTFDDVELIKRHFNLATFGDALEKYCELAGVEFAADVLPDWDACVSAFSDAKLKEIAAWRRYSLEFLARFKKEGAIGWYRGRVAFPVIDNTGRMVAVHCCRPHSKDWIYVPRGQQAWPFIIGSLDAPGRVIAAESTWDGLDYLDKFGGTGGVIISRGATNASRMAKALEPGKTVYVLMQRDEKCEHWLRDLCAAGKLIVKTVRVPEKFNGKKIHDLNDWTRAGATADDWWLAMEAAEIVATPQGNIQADGSKDDAAVADLAAERGPEPGSEPEEEPGEEIPPFPIDCLPPVLRDMAEFVAKLHGNTAMTGTIALACASAAPGGGIKVRNGRYHTTPPNLFTFICKGSASGGSQAAGLLAKPILDEHKKIRREFEEKERAIIESEIERLQGRYELLKRKLGNEDATDLDREAVSAEMGTIKVNLKKLREREALLLYVSNATPQALQAYLARHDETIFHYEPDMGMAMAILTGQNEKGADSSKMLQLELWLKGFSGKDPTSQLRLTTGHQQLDDACIAVLMLMTPDKPKVLYRDQRLIESGFLPRAIIIDPKARAQPWTAAKETMMAQLDEQHKRIKEEYHAAMAAVLHQYRFFPERRTEEGRLHPEPYVIEMDPQAKQFDIEDYNKTVGAFPPGKECPFEGRRNEIAIRIALTLYIFSCIDFKRDENGKLRAVVFAHKDGQFLTGEWMEKALKLMDYFDWHQRKFRLLGESKEEEKKWLQIREMIHDRGRGVGITLRATYKGGKVFGDRQEAKTAMDGFVKDGRVLAKPPQSTGGRPTIVYVLPDWK